MELTKMVILGGAESGVGAALLAQANGYEVFVSDYGTLKDNFKSELTRGNIEFEENGHTRDRVLNADLIVKSPGIPDQIEILQSALANGIEVISEIELAYRFTRKQIIGITGSNGKTTTTLLIYHLMQAGGFNVALAGNIGSSLAREVLKDDADIFIVELSSFQLDGIVDFKPDIAVLLNITPDHLDRYDNDFDRYAKSKLSITKNMTVADLLVYNMADIELAKRRDVLPDNLILKTFSLNQGTDAYKGEDELLFETSAGIMTLACQSLPLRGEHNHLNIMAAILVAQSFDIEKEIIVKALSSFKNYPNRLEFITDIDGVEFYNDSKATNVEAVSSALGSFSQPIVWIAGGQDKGNDYSQIKQLVKDKVKALVCLGVDNKKLVSEFSNSVASISQTENVKDAAELAFSYASASDVVLLSPACASFDLFENYAQRGAMFKEAVLNLKKKAA